MNNAITNNRTCFLESFDTVRDVLVEPNANLKAEEKSELEKKYKVELDFRRRHAKLELIISLLFGEIMVVPENVSTDSYLFHQIADNILEARNEHSKKIDKNVADVCPVWNPFRLALRSDNASYLELYAAQLKSKFKFSNSQHLNLTGSDSENEIKREQRKSIAEAILKGDFRSAKGVVSDSSFDLQIHYIEKTSNLFDSQVRNKQHITAKDKSSLLETYFDGAKQEASRYPSKYPNFPDIFNQLDRLKTDYKTRSSIYLNAERLCNDGDISPDMYKGVLELADDFYNRAIAEAVGAKTNMTSLSRSIREKYVIWADNLSQKVAEKYHRKKEGEMYLEFNSSDKKEFSWLDDIKWIDYWEIFTNEKWINSVNKLHKQVSIYFVI